MYLKLALRNARRSVMDYLLYMVTMAALTAILCVSNCMANWGRVEAGFRTASFPLLVAVMMILLANYINSFMVRQRAKEFATYLLMGMERDWMSWMFLGELSVIGLACLLVGVLLGAGIYAVYFYTFFQKGLGEQSLCAVVAKSVCQTFGYFVFVETVCIFFMRRKIHRLQIIRLMDEPRRNQPLGAGQKSLWGWVCVVSFFSFVLLLAGISFMPEEAMPVAVSLVVIPMLVGVFAFYKWLYAFAAFLRLSQAGLLYRGVRLYQMSEMTKNGKTNAGIHTIFSICLIFSAVSFMFGAVLIHPDIHVFERDEQQWMGLLQIGICVVFLTIYFFMLSLSQMIDLKRELKDIRLLLYMGKNRAQLKGLLCAQIFVKLLLPFVMSLVMLGTAVPFVNHRVNAVLPASMHNLLLRVSGGFSGCFMGLYLCYFSLVCIVCLRRVRAKL